MFAGRKLVMNHIIIMDHYHMFDKALKYVYGLKFYSYKNALLHIQKHVFYSTLSLLQGFLSRGHTGKKS